MSSWPAWTAPTQGGDDLALEGRARIGVGGARRTARGAQPQSPLGIAARQFGQQQRTHHGQLVHMLVAIHIGRRPAHGVFEGVKLRSDFALQGVAVELPKVGPRDQP